jgi:hypothetical protein
MRKARRAILQRYGLLVPSATRIHAELALGRFDGGVNLAGRHVIAFGVELEVMDQRFHRALHLAALRRHDLAVRRPAPAFGAAAFPTHCFMIFTDWRISSMRIR